MLQERGGPRRLALEAVDVATGEAVERLLGDDQPLAPITVRVHLHMSFGVRLDVSVGEGGLLTGSS
jgi:hypothetical protein